MISQINLTKMVCTLNKVLEGRAKIFIPPIPRNVFGPCCGAPTHAPNTRTAEHPKHALEEHTRMRHTIIKGLAAGGMSKHRVIDFMHGISGGSDSPSNRMAALKADTHPDMVAGHGLQDMDCWTRIAGHGLQDMDTNMDCRKRITGQEYRHGLQDMDCRTGTRTWIVGHWIAEGRQYIRQQRTGNT